MSTRILLAVALGLLSAAPAALATVKNVRVVWDGDAARQAVVGFSRSGSSASTGQYVKYGTGTDESAWQTQAVNSTRVFKSSLTSYFVRLSNLAPNTEYFFRACDASGCTTPHFFRTAPEDDRSLTVVAGGDSRTDQTNRQRGNRLVQKIRPHFVMFSGDYTDSHTASEMDTWLTDWQLSHTPTTVDGIAYRQVHPIVPTVGNHEDSDILFICTVFGVDADADGACARRDTYYAFNVGSLVRVYTLNTQFGSSMTNDRTAQRTWLNSDLPSRMNDTRWRFAQYHLPMFPRTSSKPSSNAIAVEWAAPFYDFRMNLANESDSHLVKYTYPVKLNGSAYQQVEAGTVFIGEGAWGAPIRTADRNASWTIDQDSFPHVNVLSVSADKLEIRTVYIAQEAGVSTLDKATRDASPLALPAGLALWDVANVGNVLKLKQDAQGRTQLDLPPVAATTTLPTTRDITVGSRGYRSNGSSLHSDGSRDSQETRVMMGWNTAGIAPGTPVTAARVEISVTDSSTRINNVYAATSTWTEADATYAKASITSAVLVGTVTPRSTGTAVIALNAAGLEIVRGWIDGTVLNNGFVMDPTNSDGVSFRSRESGTAPKLVIQH